MSTGVTLRERKKQATRLALHRAAVDLAAEHGLAAVTVEAIADRANVSRRTFSNYFASKEEALLYGDQMRIQALLDHLRARPLQETGWRALRNSAAEVFPDMDALDPHWLSQLQLLRRQPSLLAQQVATQAAFEQELAAEVALRTPDRSGEPLRSRVIAGAFLAALRGALQVWLEQQGSIPLSELMERSLNQISERFE